MASFSGFIGGIKGFFGAIGTFLTSFFQQETRFFQFFFDIEDTVKRAEQQIKDFKDFSFDAGQLKHRVISFPKAREAALNLYDDIINVFTERLGMLRQELAAFAKQFEAQPTPAVGAEADAGAVTNVTLKINDVLNKLNSIAKLINDILDFTEQLADIKKRIQTLDGIFLPQSSKRTKATETYYKRNA